MISPVAKRHLDRAVELTPDVRAPWYERAKLNLRLKNNQQAREDAERAANIRDSQGIIIDLQLYVLLEQIYTRLGDTELAEKYANLSQRTPVPPRLCCDLQGVRRPAGFRRWSNQKRYPLSSMSVRSQVYIFDISPVARVKNTCPNRWELAWPCSITTTMATRIYSSSTAPGCWIRCRAARLLTSPIRAFGTACIAIIETAPSLMLRR